MKFSNMRFPTSILFGDGSLQTVAEKLKGFEKQRPLVVTDRSLVSLEMFGALRIILGKAKLDFSVFSDTGGNPGEEDVEKGVEAFKAHRADSVISIGGGCALDMAKAILLMSSHDGHIFDYEDGLEGASEIEDNIPFSIAIPTTAGTGSEVGGSFVISKKVTGKKVIVWSPYLVPSFVIADPRLLVSLPKQITASTGIDALIHNIEAFLVNTFHPLCDGIALEGIHLIHKSLVTSYRDPDNIKARGDLLAASMMGGIAFQKGLGVNHSCAHALSECFDLHHGLANALMLESSMEFNLEGSFDRFSRMGQAISLEGSEKDKAEGFLHWLRKLRSDLDLSFGLREVGVSLSEDLYEKAYLDSCHKSNPRTCKKEDFKTLFEKSY